jgi:hypothetical protein
MKNHTERGYGKKIILAKAGGVLGKSRMTKLKTRQVYWPRVNINIHVLDGWKLPE